MSKCLECDETIRDNKWAHIRAHRAGWFMMKDGRLWCPKHIPKWVTLWRQFKQISA